MGNRDIKRDGGPNTVPVTCGSLLSSKDLRGVLRREPDV